MKIGYKVSEDGQIVEAFPGGILDVKTTINYFEELNCDDGIKKDAVEIVYLNNVSNFQVSSVECEEITAKYQKTKKRKKIKATIFLSNTALAYGISRMLQVFHEFEDSSHKVYVAKLDDTVDDLIKEAQK